MPLSAQQLLALALGALLVFWIVGAHNRLVALRNLISAAWAKVEESRRTRAAACEPLLAALREPLAAEAGALDALQAALAESARLAALMSARPVVATNAAAWAGAESVTSAAASRVFSLLEHSAELRLLDPVQTGTSGWREASERMRFARQLFNEAAEAYDAAIAMFPTRLLVGMFRFGKAGRL